MIKKNLVLYCLLALVLFACSSTSEKIIDKTATQESVPTMAFTKTPAPTETHVPTATIPPTATNEPTETPLPTTKLSYSTREYSIRGDFAFNKILGYYVDSKEEMIAVLSPNQEVLIYFSTSQIDDSSLTADDYLNSFVNQLSQSIQDFSTANKEIIYVSGIEGSSVYVYGFQGGDSFSGKVIAAPFLENRFFLLFSVGYEQDNVDYWVDQGEQAVTMIIDSLEFNFEFKPGSGCVVSNDMSYGFNKEYPIRVGGGNFEGPPRERAYFDNLTGPNGETVEYHRDGSIPEGETILDIYVVSYSGLTEPAILYIDQYSFEELFAPSGFNCIQPSMLVSP